MYFTKETLRSYVSTKRYETTAQRNFNRTASVAGARTIFLSHSHADLEDIQNAKALLASVYVDVYIDALDPKMPEITSPVTARLIKARIRQCDRFVVLATDRAVQSRWVPWELGYADGEKRPNTLAVLPLASNSETWPKNEYFGLYPKIELINGQATVVMPDPTSSQPFVSWLISP